MSDCGCEFEAKNGQERRVLLVLLAINLFMFLAEGIAGYIAESTSLLADALDMLADAGVYGISYYAVGRSPRIKAGAALFSGLSLIILAMGILVDISQKAILGSAPMPTYIMLTGLAALVANTTCLMILAKHKNGEVHMRASWIFSKNDVLINLGVIGGGLAVHLTSSRIPDLAIGSVITIVVLKSGLTIVKDAREELRKTPQHESP